MICDEWLALPPHYMVGMRKENQVISAEEKHRVWELQQEEEQRHEAILREDFHEILTEG